MSTRKQMIWHFTISLTIPRHHLLQGRRRWRQLARWGFPWTGPCWLRSAPCTPEERINCWNIGIFISSNNSAKLFHFKFNSMQLLKDSKCCFLERFIQFTFENVIHHPCPHQCNQYPQASSFVIKIKNSPACARTRLLFVEQGTSSFFHFWGFQIWKIWLWWGPFIGIVSQRWPQPP